MCDCDFEPPTFYESSVVKGRKEHKCSECLRVIAKGESHEYVKGLWDGHFDQFRTCSDCLAIRDELKLTCYCHGLLMDEISPDDGVQSVVDFFERRAINWQRLKQERDRKKMMQESP